MTLENVYKAFEEQTTNWVSFETFKETLIPIKTKDAPGGWMVSLADAITFLLKPRARFYAYNRDLGSVFAWNVKVSVINECFVTPDHPHDPALDDAWKAHLRKHGNAVWEDAVEDARSYYRTEWCSYPGDDQGKWEFGFGGRSGGWLCLKSWHNWDGFTNPDFDLEGFLAELADEAFKPRTQNLLAQFYVGILCADNEFTPESASENLGYQYAAARERWEEDRKNFATHLANALLGTIRRCAEDYGYPARASGRMRELVAELSKEYCRLQTENDR